MQIPTSITNQLLALISPHIGHLFADMLLALEQESEKQGYQIITASTFGSIEREERYVKSLMARRIDGAMDSLQDRYGTDVIHRGSGRRKTRDTFD